MNREIFPKDTVFIVLGRTLKIILFCEQKIQVRVNINFDNAQHSYENTCP